VYKAGEKCEVGGGGGEEEGGERPARRPLFSCYKHPPDEC